MCELILTYASLAVSLVDSGAWNYHIEYVKYLMRRSQVLKDYYLKHQKNFHPSVSTLID